MNTVAQQEAYKTDPADVAKAGYDALMQGKDKVVAGFQTKIQAAMSYILPDSVVTSNARSMMRPQGEAQENDHSGLWLTIGAAALIAAGLVVALTFKDKEADLIDEAQYRYKKGKAKYKVGKAKWKAGKALDAVTDRVAEAYHDAKATVEDALA